MDDDLCYRRGEILALRRLLHPATRGIDQLPGGHDPSCPGASHPLVRLRRRCRCPHTMVDRVHDTDLARALLAISPSTRELAHVTADALAEAVANAADYPWDSPTDPGPAAANLHRQVLDTQAAWRRAHHDSAPAAVLAAHAVQTTWTPGQSPAGWARVVHATSDTRAWSATRAREIATLAGSPTSRLLTMWRTGRDLQFPTKLSLAGRWELLDRRWAIFHLPAATLELIATPSQWVDLGPDGPLPDRVTLHLAARLHDDASGTVEATPAGAFTTAQLLTSRPR